MLVQRGTIVGSYRIEGILGRGGMGVVYSARHVSLDRRVALKVLADELSSSEEFVERFRREGRLQASLEHPHAVTVYEAGESEHGLYLAMRLISGPTLAHLIEERALDCNRALALLGQVAEALDAAHAAGLVHRDVKPQNVLVGDSDDAYLGDFGLVRLGGAAGITATGRLLGTVAYLAPEVIRGREALPASDRYAFAAMAFECLTGSVVYHRGTVAAVMYAHTNELPPRISQCRRELPQSLDEVFAQALSKDPGTRQASARKLIDTIATSLDRAGLNALGPPSTPIAALDGTTVEPEVGIRERSAPAPRRMARWLAAAALAGAGIALGASALLRGGRSHPSVEGAPRLLAGAQALGSDLSSPGRTLDCHGHQPPGPNSPSCTIMQTGLARSTLVVPEDGVIRRWEVRSARGELSLAVLRLKSSSSALQVARSQNEFAENDGVYSFPTDLAVERGDHVGVVLVAGSGIGLRTGGRGARTDRWIPRLQGATPAKLFGPGTGFDDEVLLRVEYVPGAQQQLPHQVTSSAAARLPAGRIVSHSGPMRLKDGRQVEVDVVAVAGRLVLDELVNRRRSARIDLPGYRSDGRIITYQVNVDDTGEGVEVYTEYVGQDSTRILAHYYAGNPTKFEFVN
jgi:Protein kinase domain